MRILLLTPSLPLPAMWGFNIRVLNVLRGLAKRNSVSLLCYGDPDAERASIAALEEICDDVFVVPNVNRSHMRRRMTQAKAALTSRSFHLHRYVTEEMQAELTRILIRGSFDFVQAESSAMGTFDFGTTPLILDEHNLEYELLARSNAVETSPLRRVFAATEWRKVQREEGFMWRRASGCVVTSDREQAIVDAAAAGIPTAVVPNGVDLEHFHPGDAPITEGAVVFTGLMTYRPNADGVRHFVTSILPLIRHSAPRAEFTAVGWGLPDDLRPLLGHGVTHTGRVADVRPYLAKAAVVVVPLRIGSGTRLKVLEAFAMGKAVVSTRVGCEGLEVKSGEHLIVADDPAEFAKSVVWLLNRPEEAAELGRRGRLLVEERYGWEQSVARLASFHESVFAASSPITRVAVAGAAQ